MHKIDGVGNNNGNFVSGNPEQGILPTRITPEWLNTIQNEISGVVQEAGIELNKADDTQLSQAIAWYVAQAGGGYTHPSSHSADMINESAGRKWLTPALINKWNSAEERTLPGFGEGVGTLITSPSPVSVPNGIYHAILHGSSTVLYAGISQSFLAIATGNGEGACPQTYERSNTYFVDNDATSQHIGRLKATAGTAWVKVL